MKKVLKEGNLDFAIVSGATVFCSLLTLLYNIVVRNYVAPEDYGIYVTVDLLLVYFNYLQIGVLNSYNRDYPQLLGGNKVAEAEYKRNVVWSHLVVMYGVVGLVAVIILTILLLTGRIETKLAVGFLFNVFLAFITIVYVFFDATIKSDGRFVFSAKMLILKTVVAVTVGTISVVLWGYYGLFIASGVSLICLGVVNRSFFSNLKFNIDLKMIWEMIRFGSPLLLNSLVWTLMLSIDKFVILAYLSMTDLGTYSVALLGFSLLVLIPQAMSQIFYIKMSKIYGEGKDTNRLFEHTKDYTRALSLISALVAVFAFNLLPPFIRFAIPDYTGGIIAAQILVVGVALYSTTMLFSNILSVLKLNFKLLGSTSLVCILNLGLTIFCVKVFGENINSVALGTSFSFLLYSIAVIFVTCHSLKKKFLNTVLISWGPVVIFFIPSIIISIYVKNSLYQGLMNFFLVFALLFLFYRNELNTILKSDRSQ
jgi:O-antigen/teichoic acid export membrane protein